MSAKLFNTYKKDYFAKEQKKWEADLPYLVKKMLSGSRSFLEEKFDGCGYLVDADRDGTKHLPLSSFTTQLLQQHAVILTNPKVMNRLCQHLFDGATNEQEHWRLKDLAEIRWRAKELRLNVEVKTKLHTAAGQVVDSK